MSNEEFFIKRRFIIKLGKALHKFGTPAYRLEAHLQNVARTLGIEGYFLISPTTMTFVLHNDSEQEYNHLARVVPGEVDLGSLARADELVEEVTSGQRTVEEALERLHEISEKTKPYSDGLTLLFFGVASAAFALLINTSWNDAFWSGLLGLMVYGLIYISERSSRMAEMLEPLAAILCAIFACAFALIDPGINIPVVILSGIIVFIPGLALTMGLSELAARDLISGTARIMDAMMLLFKLYFGAILGLTLGHFIFGEVFYIHPAALPGWAEYAAVPLLSASLVVLFKARIKDSPWGIISGALAYFSAIAASHYFGDSIGIFFGALIVGIYSNLYARWMKAPASIALLQGIVILVPGSKAYIGLNAMITGEMMLSQPQLGSQIFLIFMSLVAGLIFANVAVPPRRSL
ncbi:threonine/serine ThrE exporter family protein [Pelagibaculum spongiae]|uniref:Threonine/serine exporter family protein n=1 Tax=Pelagibaculum spongiae TaxID=2080658 RepID=A0A2V1GT24_9GAMM|nr:threonine/serine exporter family protein [Pelagibaculum spongiae]PVZ68442.1 hypothetical protein DC094_13450 [Pelagibaculum spongiae]